MGRCDTTIKGGRVQPGGGPFFFRLRFATKNRKICKCVPNADTGSGVFDMFGKMRSYYDDERGAVTVDWVVLTAAIVGLAAGTVFVVREATTNGSTGIGARIDQQTTDLLP